MANWLNNLQTMKLDKLRTTKQTKLAGYSYSKCGNAQMVNFYIFFVCCFLWVSLWLMAVDYRPGGFGDAAVRRHLLTHSPSCTIITTHCVDSLEKSLFQHGMCIALCATYRHHKPPPRMDSHCLPACQILFHTARLPSNHLPFLVITAEAAISRLPWINQSEIFLSVGQLRWRFRKCGLQGKFWGNFTVSPQRFQLKPWLQRLSFLHISCFYLWMEIAL